MYNLPLSQRKIYLTSFEERIALKRSRPIKYNSFSIATFTTSLVLTAFLSPLWVGYWHGLRCFQYFPRVWRCFGHIIVSLSFETGKSKIPALARISWLSVSVSRDNWHVFKWFVIDLLQSSRRTDSVTPLELPHVPLYFDKQDKKHEVSIMYSWCKFKSTRDTTKNTSDKWLLLTLKII